MLLAAWVAVVTAVAVVVPGALTGRALHLPWPVAVAAGPPVTFAIVGLWSVLLGLADVPWNLPTALAALGLTPAVCLLGARVASRRNRPPALPGHDAVPDASGLLAVAAGVGLAAVTIVVTCVRPIVNARFAGLNNITQVWDALWHASSLRFIGETGVASSLRMGELMNVDTHGFNYYPNTWHALGAVLMPVTGTDPVEQYNTYSPAVLAVTVPFGVAALAYWCARHRLAPTPSAQVAGIAAAVSALFPSLPYVEVATTSVPNAVGVSMAPIAAVLTIGATRDRRRIAVAALAISGVTATHPSGLILVAVIVGLWWLIEATGRLRTTGTLALIGATALVLIAPVIYGTTKIAENNELSGFESRDDTATVWQALGQAVFNGTAPLEHRYPLWWLVLPTLLGLIVLAGWRCWSALATWALFVLVTANSVVPLGPLDGVLSAFGGYFYNSGHRLTFVVAMFSAAAAGVCVGVVVLWAVERWRHREPLRMWAVPAAFVLVVAVIAGVAVGSYHDNSFTAARQRTPKRIGPDDLAAYHWLAEQPGARGSLILNNLDQGTGWIYPVTGLTPLFPFYRANKWSPRQRQVYWGTPNIGRDPHVDQLVRDMHIRYVIDSPPSYWEFQNGVPEPDHRRKGDPFLALRRHTPPGLAKVFHRGNVSVYKVDDDVLRGRV